VLKYIYAIIFINCSVFVIIEHSKAKGIFMQKITIEVKEPYMHNVLEMLHSLQGIMIDKIKLVEDTQINNDFIKLQIPSMKSTWDNEEDKVWDDL